MKVVIYDMPMQIKQSGLGKESPEILVSAIITTYNRSDLLPVAITSVLEQTYKNIEVIVVDDGSADETEKVVNALTKKHPLIKYYRHNTPKGACAARNLGISKANGYFIAGLDDDDTWHPERIRLLVENYSDEYSYVTAWNEVITGDTSKVARKKADISYKDILWENCSGHFPLIRTDRIRQLGGFDERLRSAQDLDMWSRLIKEFGNAKTIPYPLYRVYKRPGLDRISTSRNKLVGLVQYINKFKTDMSRRQINYHIFKLFMVKQKNVSFCFYIKMVPGRFLLKEFKRFIGFKLKARNKRIFELLRKLIHRK